MPLEILRCFLENLVDINHSSTVVNHKARLINVKKNMLFLSKKEAC